MIKLLAHTEKEREQTLLCHCQSVSKLCGQACEKVGLKNLGRLIGLLHDMGKATLLFQEYLQTQNLNLRGKINHSACGAQFLMELAKEKAIIGPDVSLTLEFATLSICGHHSGLSDCLTPSGKNVIHDKIYPQKDILYQEAVGQFTKECYSIEQITTIFENACAEVSVYMRQIQRFCSKEFPSSMQKQMHFMFGLTARFLHSALIDADRYDTYLFTYQKDMDSEVGHNLLWSQLAEKVEKYTQKLPVVTAINKIRADISKACLSFATMSPGIYRLNVPTGGGKTISSLRFAVNHAKEHNMRHIFYIAPFKTILEQTAKQFVDILGQNEIILEHHSDIVPDDGENFGDEWDRYRLLTERWTSPVILTTLVQFLQTLFSGRSSSVRRFHELQGSVVILDEVQSLPAKFVSLMNTTINYLTGILGCTVILCTATQPELTQVPIPLMQPVDMIQKRLDQIPEFHRTKIVDLSGKKAFSGEGTAAFCLEKVAADDTSSLLAIFNTKSAARKVFESLAGRDADIKTYYLSTNLCPAHRMEILDQIKDDLSSELPVICVSTQLIEAGIDISFDYAVRSLAGLSSIAQAAGRCNRNGKSKIPKEVYIIKSAEEDLTHLRDIVMEQEAVKPLLESYCRNPERYDNDLLSPAAIKAYYQNYYHQREKELNYQITEKDASSIYTTTSIYDLLSDNPSGVNACRQKSVDISRKLLYQAFDTAGSIVRVIENNGTAVIVPYGKGKEVIAKLLGSIEGKDIPLELRRAQRYTVNLSQSDVRRLQSAEALVPLAGGMALTIKDRFYDTKLGVVMEPRADVIDDYLQ